MIAAPFRRLLPPLILAMAALILVLPVPTSWAAGSLSGGALTFTTFSSLTLSGTQQTTTASWSIAPISDTTGTGAGWHLSLSLTQLQEYNASTNSYVSGGRSLPSSSITVSTPPTVSLLAQGSSPTTTVTPVAAGTALDTGWAVKLLSAAVNGGMGSYSFGPLGITLTVPASAYARTYRTDATVTLSTGP